MFMQWLFVPACLVVSATVLAGISLPDDTGNIVGLEQPATRIVSLAPHVTELLFAAGAGDKIVATVDFSNYPPAAQKIPVIGNAWRVDREALLALHPDLVIAWASGTPAREIEALRKLDLRLYLSEPRQLQGIGGQLRAFGALAGTTAEADDAAERFERALSELRSEYAGRERIRVFYQIGMQPLMTVNGEHIISAVLELCGGENVFSELGGLAQAVSVEAVIGAAPRVIVYAISSGQEPIATENFWSGLFGGQSGDGVRYVGVPADHIHRSTPRIIEGAKQICEGLEKVRQTSRVSR